MRKLDIYKVIDGSDDWPLVATLEARTDEEVIAKAEELYDQDNYHWTNPY